MNKCCENCYYGDISNKLEERGMITRIRSEQDKRNVYIPKIINIIPAAMPP